MRVLRRGMGLLLFGALSLFATGSFRPLSYELYTDSKDTLRSLEQRGYSLPTFLCKEEKPLTELATACKPYMSLLSSLAEELNKAKEKVKAHSWHIGQSAVVFPLDFLKDAKSQWSLIGVVARPDAHALDAAPCGELRLIYRLYRHDVPKVGGSFLPMTLLVTLRPPETSSCEDWFETLGRGGFTAEAFAEAGVSSFKPEGLEVNLQSVFLRGRSLDLALSQAQYLMKAYHLTPEGLSEAGLRNTPDAELIAKDPGLREDLIAWIGEHRQDVLAGSYELPSRFLSSSAFSTAPYGLERLANRPFRQILSEEDLGGGDEAAFLLRRLDAFTCQGCIRARASLAFIL